MRISVIGATGLIGAKVVDLLTGDGHDVVAASRASGVDVLTGDGLAEALAGADVLVDVVNSPSPEEGPATDFFTRSSANLVAAAKAAGVRHYVVLSIVGADTLPESGYMRAKVTQEHTIAASGLPYTIVRATQFQELTEAIVAWLDAGDVVRAPDALIQPVASDDVAAAVAHAATAPPRDGLVEIGGPEQITFADLARRVLAAQGSGKAVVVDADATYFGVPLQRGSLVIGGSRVPRP
ncbi:SDR family oxidoreductase [Mycolicibacterium sp. 120266]|uniref:SDR family oxidoreductase n=1 Tax=Mycolicibacterium sp. 120266 TaxID=3090601 RepID=UPI00299DC1BC|nr:SDR family oxidoreductase [Mycolicibacterium sp. 120266]MDX1874704.1 SDR family oxidoreductase [Mycolicibacterium sp. 120266]